jgi:hypothetical protein
MTSVWLATNGGSGEDGDEWLLFDIFATEEAASAHVAEENARRGFMEFEVEEWSVKGSPLTDAERTAIGVATQCIQAQMAQHHPDETKARELLDESLSALRSLLKRTEVRS